MPRSIPASSKALVALSILALGLLPGCGTTLVRRGLEKRLQKRLDGLLGPAEKYRVRFVGSPDAEIVRGRARRVEIDGENIMAKGEFLVNSLHLTLEDLRYEGTEPYFVSVRRSDLSVEVSDKSLNEYLKTTHLRRVPQVQFRQDEVEVKLPYVVLGKQTTITAVGRFEIEEGRRLLFRTESAQVPLMSDPKQSAEWVEAKVNPLLDLGRIEFPARLESVQLLPGRLRAAGAAALPAERS